MSVKDLKATYPPVDVMAAALEVAFPDFAPKEAWKYYREILPTLISDKTAVAKKLRDNAAKSKPLSGVIEDNFLRNLNKESQQYQLHKTYITDYLADPLAALCSRAQPGEFFYPDGGEGLVGKLCADASLLYDVLDGNPFSWEDQSGVALNLARCLARSFEGAYNPAWIDAFLQVADGFYSRLERKLGDGADFALRTYDCDAATAEQLEQQRRAAAAALPVERKLFGYLLRCAIHGPSPIDAQRKASETLLAPPPDDGYSNVNCSEWTLSQVRGQGSNITPVKSWTFHIGDAVVFGRDYEPSAPDAPTQVELGRKVPQARGANVFAVKSLPLDGSISRHHAVLVSKAGPAFVLCDEASSNGTMVQRGSKHYFLGANQKLAVRGSSLALSPLKAQGFFKTLEIEPGDIITLGLNVIVGEGSNQIEVRPFPDSLILKVTTA